MIKGRENVEDEELSATAQVPREGSLVVFPTETVYGLGGSALDEDAAKKIYAAKRWPCDNPLIAHISYAGGLEPLVKEVPKAGRGLMEAFQPGPLTMIFPKSSRVPYGITGGLDTVAVRMPDDLIANRLIVLAEVPTTAPSANTSGHPSPTTADHVWQDMSGRVEVTINNGPVGIGMESTIVDMSSPVPAVLRPGAITMEMLGRVLGEIIIDPTILDPVSSGVCPRAPGMKYKRYAPKADPTLVEPEGVAMNRDQVVRMVETVRRLAEEKCSLGFRVGITCTDEPASEYLRGLVRSIRARRSQASVAHNLYMVLREFDDLKMDFIFSESFIEDHLGQATMNHLSKAAGCKVVWV